MTVSKILVFAKMVSVKTQEEAMSVHVILGLFQLVQRRLAEVSKCDFFEPEVYLYLRMTHTK